MTAAAEYEPKRTDEPVSYTHLTSDGNYAYRHDVTEFVGATNTFDVGLESRLGVQAIVDFGSGFSVTAQEVARRRESTNFNLDTAWLYA